MITKKQTPQKNTKLAMKRTPDLSLKRLFNFLFTTQPLTQSKTMNWSSNLSLTGRRGSLIWHHRLVAQNDENRMSLEDGEFKTQLSVPSSEFDDMFDFAEFIILLDREDITYLESYDLFEYKNREGKSMGQLMWVERLPHRQFMEYNDRYKDLNNQNCLIDVSPNKVY